VEVNLFQLEGYGDKNFKRQKKGMLSSKKVSVRAMLQWQKGGLKTGLLSNAPKDASKLFAMIQSYMGDAAHKERDDIVFAHRLIDRVINDVAREVRDEIYCQVIKQLTFNPSTGSTHKGWTLLTLFVNFFPPSTELDGSVMAFCKQHLNLDDDEKLPEFAKYVIRKLPKTIELGARGRVPEILELKGLIDAPFKAAVFGVALQDVMEAQKAVDPKAELPLIMTFLCKKITELKGHQTEGIFRVPGDVGDMANLRIEIEHGDYSASKVSDAHVPGSLLKLWMRELEKPIVPTNLYDAAIDAAKADDPAKSVKIAESLPDLNRKVAFFMIEYLRDLALPENVPATKMGIPNLAMVFAPNFLRCPSEDPSVIFSTQKHQQTFVKHLIEDWKATK
jgi:hypothetical protein